MPKLPPTDLKMLNEPRPIRVTADAHGHPVTVRTRDVTRRVVRILDEWRLEDEWWRAPVRRIYYTVEHEDGSFDTIFQDLESGEWYWQRA